MSQREVERTLGKILTDEGFREEFFTNSEIACLHNGLDLSPEERDALSRLPRMPLEALSVCIDGRICRLRIPSEPVPEEPP